jgi:hypothetical protein
MTKLMKRELGAATIVVTAAERVLHYFASEQYLWWGKKNSRKRG